MTRETRELEAEIRRAFADVRPPGPSELWAEDYTDIFGVAEKVGGLQRWDDLPFPAIQSDSILNAASVQAFLFWLPGFLLAAVTDPERVDAEFADLFGILRSPGESDQFQYDRAQKHNALTAEQRQCIRDVLRFIAHSVWYEEIYPEDRDEARALLTNYWEDIGTGDK